MQFNHVSHGAFFTGSCTSTHAHNGKEVSPPVAHSTYTQLNVHTMMSSSFFLLLTCPQIWTWLTCVEKLRRTDLDSCSSFNDRVSACGQGNMCVRVCVCVCVNVRARVRVCVRVCHLCCLMMCMSIKAGRLSTICSFVREPAQSCKNTNSCKYPFLSDTLYFCEA